MLANLALMLVLPALTPVPAGARGAAAFDDPPIKVWLNRDAAFARGERARVHVRTAEDGYVVVLRADAVGRVRVLFPIDPGDDNFVRGDKSYEIRGRGDREAFAVDDREGSGLVLAARSADPFRFDEFVRGDHWDYRVLSAQSSEEEDAEAALLEIVQRMAGAAHFDYDVETYTVGSPAYHRSYVRYYDPFYGPCFGCSSWYDGRPYGFRVSLVFGSPYRYRLFYHDPFFYDPFFYDPFLYDPFFYRPVFYDPFCGYRSFCYRGGYGFSTSYHRPAYWGGFAFRRPSYGAGVFFGSRRAPRFVIPRDRAPIKAIEPRARVPENRGLGRRAVVSERPERSPAWVPRERPRGTDRWRVSSGVRERRLVPAAPITRERVSVRSRPAVGRGPAIGRAARPNPSVRSGRSYAPSATRGGVRAAHRGERGTGRRQR